MWGESAHKCGVKGLPSVQSFCQDFGGGVFTPSDVEQFFLGSGFGVRGLEFRVQVDVAGVANVLLVSGRGTVIEKLVASV